MIIKKPGGNIWSIVCKSLENLDNIRPVGVVSKNNNGNRNKLNTKKELIALEALVPAILSSRFPIDNGIARRKTFFKMSWKQNTIKSK